MNTAARATKMPAAPCEEIAMAPELWDVVFPLESELPLDEGLTLLLDECDPEGVEAGGLEELGAGVLTPNEGGGEDGGGTEPDGEELRLLSPPPPTIFPVPQGILSPLGWTSSVGGVVAPEASAMAKRVVQYVVFEVGSLNW